MIIGILAAVAGAVTFAVILNVPVKYYVECGIISGIGWGIYLLISQRNWDPEAANFIASLITVFLSRLSATWHKCPVTVFAVPALVPEIPGGSIFQTMYYLAVNQTGQALGSGLAALKISIAIAFALIIVLEIPERVFWILAGRKTS